MTAIFGQSRPTWCTSLRRLRIEAATALEVVREARAAAPLETVGLLSGQELRIATRCHPLPNVATDATCRFLADPHAQFVAEQEIAAAGEYIVAIYHSHPNGDAGFSEIDKHFSSRWDCVHLVVGLSGGVQVRAYERDPLDDLVEVTVEIGAESR
ncbi:MAG: hypothetical protein GKS06_11195 [Acidobacteria bacterium]|nr:hypothetical protein [Acidobacteriota bacterium]